MYKCQSCGNTVPPKIKCHKVATEERKKIYEARYDVNRPAKWKEERSDRILSTNDAGGIGKEIVTELHCCPSCANKLRPTLAL